MNEDNIRIYSDISKLDTDQAYDIINYNYSDKENFVRILCEVKDDNFKKEFIEKGYPVGPDTMAYICESINDDSIIKDILNDSKNLKSLRGPHIISHIISQMKDNDIKKEFIDNRNKYGLSPNECNYIAETITDDNIKQEMVENFEKYGFLASDVSNIVSTMNDDNIKINIINNSKKYALNSFNVKDIAQSIKDEKIKQGILDNIDNYAVSLQEQMQIIEQLHVDSQKQIIESQGRSRGK